MADLTVFAYPSEVDVRSLSSTDYLTLAESVAHDVACAGCGADVHVCRVEPGRWQSLVYHEADCPALRESEGDERLAGAGWRR